MARVGEFCAANVTRLLLGVVILVALLLCAGVWMYYSSGHGQIIKESPKECATLSIAKMGVLKQLASINSNTEPSARRYLLSNSAQFVLRLD
jgi:hypothetical protein